MKFRVSSVDPDAYSGPLLAVGLFKPARDYTATLRMLEESSKGLIGDLLSSGDFRADWREIMIQHTLGRLPAKRVLLFGLGERDKWTLERWRGCVSQVALACRGLGSSRFALSLDVGPWIRERVEELSWAAVEGALLGLYRFERYRKREESWREDPEEITLIVGGGAEARRVRREIRRAQLVCDAVRWARDLVSQPPNLLNPSSLAEAALEMAKERGLRAQLLTSEDLETLGMGGLVAVGSGGGHPPRVVVLEHLPAKATGRVALVGKGITFDSGGVNLKPSDRLNLMKYDMSGGATVLGVMMAAGLLDLPVHIVGIVPMAENLLSGNAYKPGDIIRMINGVSVEVTNTDAEGRLILADCLAYAQRYSPDAIIDVATLTGACVVALGDQMAGIMGNNEPLLEELQKAGTITGERLWPLPLPDEYEEYLKSSVADVRNAGGREAGAIQGGLFLRRFVGKTPWVHMDIAGPVWTEKDLPYRPKGATGFGVRLLVRFLEGFGPFLEGRLAHQGTE